MFIELKKNKYNDFYAHRKDGKTSETLIEHSDLTKLYFEKILKTKNLNAIIDKLILKIDNKYNLLIKRLFINAIYLHDLGKTNPAFQANKMNNPLFEKTTLSSNHSLLGAELFIDIFKSEISTISDDKEYYKMLFILYNFAYQISKHHGKLTNIDDFFSEDEDFDKSYSIQNYFEFYILNKLLFSLLISADYYATTEYMTDFPINDFGLFSKEDKENLITRFNTYTSNFQNPQGINKLRNEMFIEAEYNLNKNLDKNIFYLEAPTGSGKTITSINLALKLLESDENLNKLFYIFPFNTLVEQTKNVFDEIFEDKLNIDIINSITPLKIDNQEEKETNYTEAYINRLFFHSPAIITTHVSLFNILFGTSKDDNFPLWQLANSVIILDEIQSYNNHLWWYMVEFFDKYASLLNMKIIIMSATLPKLDFFLKSNNNFVDLISKEKKEYFFKNELFKNRVKVNFDLLQEDEITFERLEDFFQDHKENHKKILFEFIKKQSAREFYNIIKEKYENVYELSGDDNKAYRQFVINKSKEDNPVIIIATQVIEAGVDIDIDIGFKDISTIDSEEQFMGRINRSCKKSNSKVYFFNMDDVSKIYKNDNRLGFDLKNPIYQEILQEKDFSTYYAEVLKVIQDKGLRYDKGVITNYDNFSDDIKKLNYTNISKTMTLINSQNYTLYFPFKLDITKYTGVKEFENQKSIEIYLDGNMLDGQKIWDEFQKLSEIKNFTEQEFHKSKINSLMQFFTFNIFKFNEKDKPPYYNYEYNGYYFVQNHEDFIDDGKFDRKKYIDKKDELFL